MMDYELSRAISGWEIQLNAEMVRLIEQGVPPFDAAVVARENVSRRRRNSTKSATTPEVKSDAE